MSKQADSCIKIYKFRNKMAYTKISDVEMYIPCEQRANHLLSNWLSNKISVYWSTPTINIGN